MKVYKVVTMKDRWFAGGFTPANLEAAINALAREGWRLVSTTAADFGGEWGIADTLGKTRVQMALFFEREVENLEAYEAEEAAKANKLAADGAAATAAREAGWSERQARMLQPGTLCPKCGAKNTFDFALARCSKCQTRFV